MSLINFLFQVHSKFGKIKRKLHFLQQERDCKQFIGQVVFF